MNAQHNLANMYLRGKGIPKGKEKAIYWFQKAAEQGHPLSQHQVGTLYLQGTVVLKGDVRVIEVTHQDEKQGFYWLEKAAQQEFAESFVMVGCCYLTGSGVDQDQNQAYHWFEKAVEKGVAPPEIYHYLGERHNALASNDQENGDTQKQQQNLQKAMFYWEKAAAYERSLVQDAPHAQESGTDKVLRYFLKKLYQT